MQQPINCLSLATLPLSRCLSAQPIRRNNGSKPIDLAAIDPLRQLKQMKDDGLLLRNGYVWLGNDLIGQP